MDNIVGYYLMPHIPELIYEIADSNMNRLKRTSEACEKIGEEISNIKPKTIVILSSHGSLKADTVTIKIGEYIYGDFKEFKNVDISYVTKLDNIFSQCIIEYLKSNSVNYNINDIDSNDYKLDHGAMVPLYFVNKYYKDYELVTISSNIKDKDKLFEVGKAIRNACESLGKSTVVIASCDAENNKDLQETNKNIYRRELNDRRISEDVNNTDIFKNYDTQSKRFKEFERYNINYNYLSFILGALGGRKIKSILLAYEKVFNLGYSVVKFKTT